MRDDSRNSVTSGARGERALPGAQRPAPSPTSHFTRRSRTESRPAPRRRRRVALACAALALLGLLAHPSPASAQTVVWTATFTPADLGFSVLGCSAAVDNKHCSSTSILSEDSFTHDSTDYSVTLLFLRGTGRFEFTVDTDITTATAALTLEVGTTSLVLADAEVKTARNRGWDNSGVSLSTGTAVTVKLTELDETPPTLTSATVSGPGGSIALAFSEDLQSANLPPPAAFTPSSLPAAVPLRSPKSLRGLHGGCAPPITVSTLIAQGQAVVVAYADPTGTATTPRPSRTPSATTPPTSPPAPAASRPSPTTPSGDRGPTRSFVELAASRQHRPGRRRPSSGCCSSPPPSATPCPPTSRTTTPSSRPAPRPATPTSRPTARASGRSRLHCRRRRPRQHRTTGTGVPIYWLDGTKVADDYADFYDGSWDDEVNDKNESGTDAHDTSQRRQLPHDRLHPGRRHRIVRGRNKAALARRALGVSAHRPAQRLRQRPATPSTATIVARHRTLHPPHVRALGGLRGSTSEAYSTNHRAAIGCMCRRIVRHSVHHRTTDTLSPVSWLHLVEQTGTPTSVVGIYGDRSGAIRAPCWPRHDRSGHPHGKRREANTFTAPADTTLERQHDLLGRSRWG